jgi:hypothetical protein
MEPMQQVQLRVSENLMTRADLVVEILQRRNPGMAIHRSDAFRRGLLELADRLEAEERAAATALEE